jgi:hypothetical protein
MRRTSIDRAERSGTAKRTRSAKPRSPRMEYKHPTVLLVIMTLIVLIGMVAGGGAARGFLWLPPAPVLALMGSVLATFFFVLAALIWFIGSIFGDRRFAAASPASRIKLATRALAPVMTILGLLPKIPGSSGASS